MGASSLGSRPGAIRSLGDVNDHNEQGKKRKDGGVKGGGRMGERREKSEKGLGRRGGRKEEEEEGEERRMRCRKKIM